VATTSPAQPPAPSDNKPNDDSFVIGNDDLLAINVWKEPDFSQKIQVRSDGKISLPLLGEIQATGLTPLQLERDLTAKLRNYITKPEVTVMVEQVNSKKFNILGQVAPRPASSSTIKTSSRAKLRTSSLSRTIPLSCPEAAYAYTCLFESRASNRHTGLVSAGRDSIRDASHVS
jgi:hypothetical protein